MIHMRWRSRWQGSIGRKFLLYPFEYCLSVNAFSGAEGSVSLSYFAFDLGSVRGTI